MTGWRKHPMKTGTVAPMNCHYARLGTRISASGGCCFFSFAVDAYSIDFSCVADLRLCVSHCAVVLCLMRKPTRSFFRFFGGATGSPVIAAAVAVSPGSASSLGRLTSPVCNAGNYRTVQAVQCTSRRRSTYCSHAHWPWATLFDLGSSL